jgi:hypothetical protein
MPDLCTISGPGVETRDSFGEISTADASIATNVPCEYSALSVYERQSGGETAQTATHKLKLPATAETLAIGGSARGVIAARGASPEMSFEVTGRLDDSTGIFLWLAIVMR